MINKAKRSPFVGLEFKSVTGIMGYISNLNQVLIAILVFNVGTLVTVNISEKKLFPAIGKGRFIFIFSFFFFLLVFLSFLSYSTGFNGPFIFDDMPNLEALSQIQGESIFSPGFWEFVFSGNAGPTGRPFSLFTFALQAESWPNNPGAHKLVNFIIHTISSGLVAIFCCQLCLLLKVNKKQIITFGLFVTAVWTLHPIQSTSVLYSIQRMALLSNAFILLGVVLHIVIRLKVNTLRPYASLVLATLSLGLTGLLALLSKENAPSLFLYILALEYTILSTQPINKIFKLWRLVCLWLPLVLLILISVFFMDQLHQNYQNSFDFTMLERVLTENRVLWQYLQLIMMPSVSGSGLFHTVEISTSLFSPLSTIISILAWIILLVLAIKFRLKQPVFSFAVLWYLAGHAVESSFLPLELFFNHRNYLAFLGPLFALTYYASRFDIGSSKLIKAAKFFAGGFIVLLLWIQSVSIATLWNDPALLAANWYLENPGTIRNGEFYAIQQANSGSEGILQAADIYDQIIANNPTRFRLILNRMTLNCLSESLPTLEANFIQEKLFQRSLIERDILSPLRQLLDLSLTDNCPAIQTSVLENILDTLYPTLSAEDQGILEYERARLRIAEGNIPQAILLFESAYEKTRDTGILFTLGIYLIREGNYNSALEKIDEAIAQVYIKNNINTGTRASKIERLNSMRNDILQFMEAENRDN